MTTIRISSSGLLLLAWGFFPVASPALDGGLPLLGSDVDARITVDVYTEDMSRDIRQEIAFTDLEFDGEQDEKRLVARVTGYPTTRLSVYLMAGITDSLESEELAPLAGGGLRLLLHRIGDVRFSLFAGGYLVDDIAYEVPGRLTPIAEIAASRRVENYYEAGGGLSVDWTWSWTPRLQLMPYAGLSWSTLQGEGEETFVFASSGQSGKDDEVDLHDDSPLTLTTGVALLANRNYGLRLEGRFLDQNSYSAGLFFSF